MVTGPAQSPKGRPKGHAYEAWRFLGQYEEWDEQERQAWRFQRSKTAFFRHLPLTFASGNRCLLDYGLPWPPVPRFDEQNRPVLTYLIHVRPPFELLWLCKTTCSLLGLERDEVIGRPAMDVLKPGEDLYQTEPEHAALAEALARGEVADNLAVVPRSHLVHSNGMRLPVELHIRYGAGPPATFYAEGHVTGPLYEPTTHRGQLTFDGFPTLEFNGQTTERITRKLFDQWDQERRQT